jgi:hypothetical protein
MEAAIIQHLSTYGTTYGCTWWRYRVPASASPYKMSPMGELIRRMVFVQEDSTAGDESLPPPAFAGMALRWCGTGVWELPQLMTADLMPAYEDLFYSSGRAGTVIMHALFLPAGSERDSYFDGNIARFGFTPRRYPEVNAQMPAVTWDITANRDAPPVVFDAISFTGASVGAGITLMDKLFVTISPELMTALRAGAFGPDGGTFDGMTYTLRTGTVRAIRAGARVHGESAGLRQYYPLL